MLISNLIRNTYLHRKDQNKNYRIYNNPCLLVPYRTDTLSMSYYRSILCQTASPQLYDHVQGVYLLSFTCKIRFLFYIEWSSATHGRQKLCLYVSILGCHTLDTSGRCFKWYRWRLLIPIVTLKRMSSIYGRLKVAVYPIYFPHVSHCALYSSMCNVWLMSQHQHWNCCKSILIMISEIINTCIKVKFFCKSSVTGQMFIYFSFSFIMSLNTRHQVLNHG
jgi:hypothetical protein